MHLIYPSSLNIDVFYQKYYRDVENDYTKYRKVILALIKSHPSHSKLSHVLPKVILINSVYSTSILAIKEMSKHITRSKELKRLIAKGSEDAIVIIGKQHNIKNKNDKGLEFYSFATKYCNCHNPSKYPIYDGNVDYMLWEYQKKYNFKKGFKRKDLKDYTKFKEILYCFKHKFGLGKMSNEKLDKFLWKQRNLLRANENSL